MSISLGILCSAENAKSVHVVLRIRAQSLAWPARTGLYCEAAPSLARPEALAHNTLINKYLVGVATSKAMGGAAPNRVRMAC